MLLKNCNLFKTHILKGISSSNLCDKIFLWNTSEKSIVKTDDINQNNVSFPLLFLCYDLLKHLSIFYSLKIHTLLKILQTW